MAVGYPAQYSYGNAGTAGGGGGTGLTLIGEETTTVGALASFTLSGINLEDGKSYVGEVRAVEDGTGALNRVEIQVNTSGFQRYGYWTTNGSRAETIIDPTQNVATSESTVIRLNCGLLNSNPWLIYENYHCVNVNGRGGIFGHYDQVESTFNDITVATSGTGRFDAGSYVKIWRVD